MKKLKSMIGIVSAVALLLAEIPFMDNQAEAASKPALVQNTFHMLVGSTRKIKLKKVNKKAKITYKSTRTTVASVTKKGKVKAKKAGTAVIRVTVVQGRKFILKCKIKVKKKKENSVSTQVKITPAPLVSSSAEDTTATIIPDTPIPETSAPATASPGIAQPSESPTVTSTSAEPVFSSIPEHLGELKLDITGVRVGARENAVFSVKRSNPYIFNEISLFCDRKFVGIMHDDGENGDAVANDGIFSFQTSCYKNSAGTEEYYAADESMLSNTIQLHYFDKPSEQDIEVQNDYIDTFEKLDCESVKVDGTIDEEKAVDRVYQYAQKGYEKGDILNVQREEDGVTIQFSTGLWYMYAPDEEGVDAVGDGAQMQVVSLQPSYSMREEMYQDLSTLATDGSAEKLAEKFKNFQFTKNYDDEAVSLDVINNLTTDSIVLSHSHGGYSSEFGSVIFVGEKWDKQEILRGKYLDDCQSGRLLLGKKGCFGFTSAYVTAHCKSLEGGFIYLAACNSGKDDRLAKSFLNKGVRAVVGNTGKTYEGYNCRMMADVVNGLLSTDSNTGQYFTLKKALAYAKMMNGKNDAEKWEAEKDHMPSTAEIFGDENFRLSGTVDVTSISLDRKAIAMNAGDFAKLTATVLPSDASDKKVKWSSSDTNVVEVTGGIIKAKKKGLAVITAKTSNELKASCSVFVSEEEMVLDEKVLPEKIELNPTKSVINVGDTIELTAKITPANVTEKKVTWSSSDEKIAKVDGNGKVTALYAGLVVITVTTVNGLKAKCTLTVEDHLTLNYTDLTLYSEYMHDMTFHDQSMEEGEKRKPYGTVFFYYDSAPDVQLVAYRNGEKVPSSQIEWSNEGNFGYGLIDDTGFVKSGFLGAGFTGMNMKVSFYEKDMTFTAKLKENPSIYAKAVIHYIYNPKFTFKSSNTNILTVDKDGMMYAKKAGEVKVTIREWKIHHDYCKGFEGEEAGIFAVKNG